MPYFPLQRAQSGAAGGRRMTRHSSRFNRQENYISPAKYRHMLQANITASRVRDNHGASVYPSRSDEC